MKASIPLPSAGHLSEAQQAIHDAILATRGNLDGPFLAWLHNPAIAGPSEKLGAACRYHSGLALIESELLILCVASHLACAAEAEIHEPIALKAGLPHDAVIALRRRDKPSLPDPRLRVLVDVAFELLGTHRLTPGTLTLAETTLGIPGLVGAVAVIGYYCHVAMTLNAFSMRT